MSRGNQILSALLVVQIAVAVLVFWPREAAVAGGEPLLAGIEADQVVRVTISDLVDGQIQMAKVQGAWVLSGGVSGAALVKSFANSAGSSRSVPLGCHV